MNNDTNTSEKKNQNNDGNTTKNNRHSHGDCDLCGRAVTSRPAYFVVDGIEMSDGTYIGLKWDASRVAHAACAAAAALSADWKQRD